MPEDLSAVATLLTAYSILPSNPHHEWLRERLAENRRVIESRLDCQPQPLRGSQQNAPGYQQVVLVVDDELSIAITLREILNRSGIPSVWLTGPRDAASLLGRLPVRLLITDIDMPGMNGVALAAMARKRGRCPVLFFSAHGKDEETSKRVDALDPCVHMQTKPVSAHLLLAVVRQLCAMPES